MDIEKLIEQLRTESLYADKASLEIMDLCMEAATALSTLQAENKSLRVLVELGNTRAKDYSVMRDRAVKAEAENENLRAELERKNEALDFSKTTDAEAVRITADLIRVTAERDALIKRTAGDCWSCIRRYECNNRKGPHKRCWEFDPWLLREDCP